MNYRARCEQPGRPPTRIALVNNMPDSAFEETRACFDRLLRQAPVPVEIRNYYIASVPRHPEVIASSAVAYLPTDALYDEPVDALIVTGTEPKSPDLVAEPYWPALSELLEWGAASVPSMLLSCLASHAAALCLDGIARRPLPGKLSGVFTHAVDQEHFLGRRMPQVVALPHSRLNDIPAPDLVARGYRIVLDATAEGWAVATRERAGRLLTLLQGHPEYAPTALLREYRRDLRRYREGCRPVPPTLPEHYLDSIGTALVQEFTWRALADTAVPAGRFPCERAAEHIAADWDGTSRQLFSNWVADAAARCEAATVGSGGGVPRA